MSAPTSDTTLIQRLKNAPDAKVQQETWQRYLSRLVAVARSEPRNATRRVRDEEDVALSVFDSLFRGVERGRFPQLDDEDDLWQVLMLLTERKAIDQYRRDGAAKRGGGRVRGDSAFGERAADLGEVQPTPEMVDMFTEECQRLFEALDGA